VPAKSKHMEQRKQRIANAKKNARLAGKLRRRRRLQALGGLLAVAAVLTLVYLWQDGFFKDEEPTAEETPTSEITESVDPLATETATDAATDAATDEATDTATETPTETESE
jgi:cytoskeletal protein RodZ